MKINVVQNILTPKGDEIKDENGESINVRDSIYISLVNFKQEENPSAEIKLKAYKITNKLYTTDEVDFEIPELAFIKERVGIISPVPVMGFIFDLIENTKSNENSEV